MWKQFTVPILVATFCLFSSCSRDILPVFELYVTIENAQEYNNIKINSSYLDYGLLDDVTQKPSSGGNLFLVERELNIPNTQNSNKIFLTSTSKNIGSIEFLSLNGSLDLKREELNIYSVIDRYNNIFPIEFTPENGEAYEINFIIDIKNSVLKKGDYYDFELGGDSRVVITKY